MTGQETLVTAGGWTDKAAGQLLKALEDIWAGYPELGNGIIRSVFRDPESRTAQ